MASIDRLFFELGIDPSGMRKGATQAQGIFGSLSKRAKIAIGVLGGFTAVFAAIGAKSVAAASKFQDAFNEVRTLIDETTTDSKLLRREVLKLSAAVGRPPEEVSRGLYQVISAGVTDAAEAMDVLEIATKASIGGLTDQFTAVDAVTTVLNAYNLEASEAEHVTDLMLNAVKEGKLTFSDLASNIGKVVSTAALAGIGFDEVSAALATMTKAGLSTELATTSLNTLLLKIIDSEGEAQQAAEDMGLEWNLAALRARGLTGLMKDLSEATGGNVEKLKSVVKELEAFKGASILAGTGLDEMTRIMETTQDVTGTTQEFFRKIKQSVTETAREINTRLTVAFINLGTKILPSINTALRGILNLIDEFTKTDLEKSIAALDKISGVEALVKRLELQQQIDEQQKRGTKAAEELLAIQKGQFNTLEDTFIFQLRQVALLDIRTNKERELLNNIIKQSEGENALADLTKTEIAFRNELINIEKQLGEARFAKNENEIKHLEKIKSQRTKEIDFITQLLVLVSTVATTREDIAEKQEQINELLTTGVEKEKETVKAAVEVSKSITVQQDELQEKIRLIEMGAASEITLIELTGKLEKIKAGEILAQVAEIRNATIDRLEAHLKEAEIVYGAESQFVKDLKIAITQLKIEAEKEITVTLETDLVLKGIDKSSRAIAGLGRELLGLSSTSELTIRRIGDMAAGMLDMRSALRSTEAGLLDKVIPALGLFTTGISIMKGLFGSTKTTTDDLSAATRRYEERLRRLKDAIDAQVGLQDLNEQEQLIRKLKQLGSFAEVFGFDIDEDIVRRFARGETLLSILGGDLFTNRGKRIAELFAKLGFEGIKAFVNLQDIISSALEDGFISDAEARAIDAAIAQLSTFTNVLTSMNEEALNTLIEIENLTDSLIRLADAAAAATAATGGTVVDREIRLTRRARIDPFISLATPRRRRFMPITDDDLLDSEEIARQGATRDFRQFVGITEIQGNILLGILNTSLDVQRRQLDFFMNSFDGIGGIGELTIGQFNFEVNFGTVSLGSDQDITNVSEQLANETIRALRAVGTRG